MAHLMVGAFGDVLAQSVDDLEKIDEAIDTSSASVWEIAVAIAILVFAWPLSALLARVARRIARRVPSTPDYVPELVGRSIRALTILIAVAWAMSLLGVDVGWFALVVALVAVIVFLMVRPLIENLAAGLLLQSRPSFGVGDEIKTNGFTGDVVLINARSTVIQTRDWRRIHIPNEDVLDNAIEVYTAFERRRSAFVIGVDYAANIAEVEQVLLRAMKGVEGVFSEPAPQVQARGFGDGVTLMRLRWWHDAKLSAESRTLDRVVRAVKSALDEAGIDMPSPEVRLTGGTSIDVAKLDDD